MKLNLNAEYWDSRYKQNDFGWDLGQVSPPIKSYVDKISDKSIRILIPGGGHSWEAEYLHNNGFINVFVADIATTALNNLKLRVPNFPENHLLNQDFFLLNDPYDLIIEQTFFCAINPELRYQYVKQAHHLLKQQGKLAGLLFNVPLNDDRPPFGGNQANYRIVFSKYFKILKMEPATKSVESRLGRELFFECLKQ